jgi:hypothetical protein
MRIVLPGSSGMTFSQIKPVGNISLYYNGTVVGNHAETTRDSYTIPTGKYATVDFVYFYLRCAASLNEVLPVTLSVKVSYAGGSAQTIFHYSDVLSMDGLVVRDSAHIGTVLMPGDVISITTRNQTTSASYDFIIFVALTLYLL